MNLIFIVFYNLETDLVYNIKVVEGKMNLTEDEIGEFRKGYYNRALYIPE